MPWQEQSIMGQKQEFIRRYVSIRAGSGEADKVSMSALCRAYGISRPTGYRLVARHEAAGDAGLCERSRRPHHSPHRTPARMERRVVRLRRKYPCWGGRKIRHRLLLDGVSNPPAVSTITGILRRAGLLSAVPEARDATQRFEMDAPNMLWQVDFKGHHPTLSGARCHPLCVIDDHSRFNITLRACVGERAAEVWPALRAAFRDYGMPAAMQCDNGPPWGAFQGGRRVLTTLGAHLMRLGVKLIRIRPHHPQSNGKVERFHRTLKAEVISQRTFADLADCQRQFGKWRDTYNLLRPHQALGQRVPAACYQPSPRAYPERLPDIAYPDGVAVRQVADSGRISFKGQLHRISKALAGQPVALFETAADGTYAVFYCTQQIAHINLRDD